MTTSRRRKPDVDAFVATASQARAVTPTALPKLVPQPRRGPTAIQAETEADTASEPVVPGKLKRRRVAYKQDTITNLIQSNRRTVFPFPRIQNLMDVLPVCRYEFLDSESKMEQDDLVAALRHPSSAQRLLLPLFSNAYESQLMREAGTFRIAGRMITFPACRFGEHCVGRATGPHAIPDLPGVTLMALLFEEELNTVLDTGSVDLRGNLRPCILCYRHILCDFLFSLQPRHAAPLGSTCIQIYHNLKASISGSVQDASVSVSVCVCYQDEAGGYHGQYMLDPARTHYSGIVSPIVMFQPQLLRGRIDVEERRWTVDQSTIVWKPPLDNRPCAAGTPLGLFARHACLQHAASLRFRRD